MIPVSQSATTRPAPAGAGNILADLPAPVAFSMPTPPSANHLFKNIKGIGRVRSSVYDDFVRRGVAAIRAQAVPPIPGRVIALFGVERMSDLADIDNRLKAMLDTIVKAEIIADDRFVTSIAISWLPMANGLSWVRLLPVQKLDLTFHPSQDGASGGWFSNAPSTQQQDFEHEALRP